MAQAQEQTHRPTEENKGPRNKPMQLQPPHFLTKGSEAYTEEETAPLTNDAKKK